MKQRIKLVFYYFEFFFIIIRSNMQDQQLNKSSVETTTQKFHLKTIQNKSMVDIKISNAIKKGTVKNFIKSGLSVTLDTPIEDGVDKGLQGHLLQLKKSCSDLTRELKDKQVQANRYKDEVGFTSEKAKKIKDNRRKLEDKIAELQRNLNQVSTKKQSALHCSKTYEHILERMKKDGIYKQLQKNQMQRQLKLLYKSHGLTQAKNFSALQFEKLSTIGLREANEEVSLQGNIRKNKLSSVNKETAKKMDLKNKLNERQKQTDQIQELAACDIQDADLLRLKKFLTVQIFLKNLLKSKMNKLKQNFLPYEKAFFQIKSNTCVKDAGSLKKEFLNFEHSYNEKTVWVAHLQEQIAESQQNNENLKKKLNQIMLNHMQIVQSMENANKQVERGSLKKLHEKSFIFESTWQRVNSWLKIQARKLGLDEQKAEQKLLEQIIKKINEAQKPEEESKVQVIKQVNKQNKQNNQVRQSEVESEQSKLENEKDENSNKNQQQ